MLHKWCALSSPVWCAYQLSLCDAGNAPAAGLSLFAMAFLFSASALYHRGRWTLAQEQRLMKLDYIGIFLLVAFSVAPCYVMLLPPAASYPVLGAPPSPPPSNALSRFPATTARSPHRKPPPPQRRPAFSAEPNHALHAGLLALTVVAGAWLTLAELNLGRHGMVAVYVAQVHGCAVHHASTVRHHSVRCMLRGATRERGWVVHSVPQQCTARCVVQRGLPLHVAKHEHPMHTQCTPHARHTCTVCRRCCSWCR